ncbi:MAG TPA: hypothetical protein VHB48_20100 [Chitinophagaceae bacterium]|nr:hypothetical protein [Chitinophagaceae bacterium]
MNELDNKAFVRLFKDACEKCFGQPLTATLTETESKLFCNTIIDKTGLIIGFKSIKNYSAYVLNESPGKQENPSPATLDTLARYVLDAPYTDELKRKKFENHYPYWYAYKDKFLRLKEAETLATTANTPVNKNNLPGNIITAVILLAIIIAWLVFNKRSNTDFADNFSNVSTDTLTAKGWIIKTEDTAYWNRRDETPGVLSLFTLKGDNWPDTLNNPGIKNLLLRPVPGDCFMAEVHLEKFMPHQNWQQAGILLMEDTVFKGRTIRLSIAYNDYMGGLPLSKKIIIQAVASLGSNYSKPEEIAQSTIINLDSAVKIPVILHSLDHSALRIEKQGNTYRMLFADGVSTTTAFREIVTRDFEMKPKYIGIFALRGFVDSAESIPAKFTFFRLTTSRCKE